jgi:hypothetical protein
VASRASLKRRRGAEPSSIRPHTLKQSSETRTPNRYLERIDQAEQYVLDTNRNWFVLITDLEGSGPRRSEVVELKVVVMVDCDSRPRGRPDLF